MKKLFALGLAVSTLVGCGAPRYSGHSVPDTNQKPEVVIVKDNATRSGFLATMEQWLQEHEYTYTVVPEQSQHDLDKLTLEYEGRWSWDLALYLSDADIQAFLSGQRVGKVEFNVPYTANPNKFGDASERIGYMMDTLFGLMTAEQATKIVNSTPEE
ncbi:hypothetical protein AKJ18_13630 [Vibrio xuii]|nr:hypothetical protein AKJ18_13630 [Vibrio xuii]